MAAAVTTARPTSFFEPRTSSAKLIPLSYPFTENRAVASAVTIRPVPIADTPVVPVGPTGWLRIDSGWCQWLNPATASAPTTISSIARQMPVNQALNLICIRQHQRDQDHPEARDQPGRDARVERVHVGADADGDAGRQEDGLPDVVDHGHEPGGPAEHPGDDRVEAAGDREHRPELAHAERDIQGDEAADEVGPHRAGACGRHHGGAYDQQRRGRGDVRQDQCEVPEGVHYPLQFLRVPQRLQGPLRTGFGAGYLLCVLTPLLPTLYIRHDI